MFFPGLLALLRRLRLRAKGATVFPAYLVHFFTCMEKERCTFLNSPGHGTLARPDCLVWESDLQLL